MLKVKGSTQKRIQNIEYVEIQECTCINTSKETLSFCSCIKNININSN